MASVIALSTAEQEAIKLKKSLMNSDPGRILALIMNLDGDKCGGLQAKINTYLMNQCESATAFMVIVNKKQEAYIESVGPKVIPMTKVDLNSKMKECLASPFEMHIFFSDLGEDLQKIVLKQLLDNFSTKKRVVMYSKKDEPFSLIVFIVLPKQTVGTCVRLFRECFVFIWPILRKAILLQHEVRIKQNCQQMLRCTRKLFSNVVSLDKLVASIRTQMRHLLRAHYCTIFMVDVEKSRLVEATCPMEIDDEFTAPRTISLHSDTGLTGQVLKSGILINLRDVESDPRYVKAIDCPVNKDPRTLLCFPLRDKNGIIGICQVMNKIGGATFDSVDEELALGFSIYCGNCIVHAFSYERTQEAHIKNCLAHEVVLYHLNVKDSDADKILKCDGFHGIPNFYEIKFNTRALPLRELPCYVFKMFMVLNFDLKFKMQPGKIAKFIALVKNCYRDVPYHNWSHAVATAHWAFAVIYNFKLVKQGYMSELQALMYFLSALMHDLDHRGTSCTLIHLGNISLSAHFTSECSLLERHHLNHALSLLNTDGCDILANLSIHDYDRALIMLRDNILATDLSVFFKKLNEYRSIASTFQKENQLHSDTLVKILMNAADFSDHIKDWDSVKKTASAIFSEFFCYLEPEGPENTKDKAKYQIPDLMLDFLATVCEPLYELFGEIFKEASNVLEIIEDHEIKWESSKIIFDQMSVLDGIPMLMSDELDAAIEAATQERERQRLLELEQEQEED